MSTDGKIAVIGMAGRFPGARDLRQFWRNLCDGIESVSGFTADELLAEGANADLIRDPRFVAARAVLEDADQFDAGFFRYSRGEAELMDPQHRVFLEVACEALEDAGCVPGELEGSVAVFAGTGFNTYLINNIGVGASLDASDNYSRVVASDKDFVATRVAYKLNLRGAAITVQTACSTSLVAIHMACQALLTYQSDAALAGGVSIAVPQKSGYLHQAGMILSPDGHCRAFDARASGTVFGSGAGVVVLKRLEDAIRSGDRIHGVVLGSAVNNDGAAKVGFTAPSVDGQAQCIALAQAMAGVGAESITCVEAHGTATALGDPMEVAALTQAFRQTTGARGFCALGSVKTNIGHTDVAAGVAGFIKAVLSVREGLIPPSLHYERPNPEIDFDASPFFVNRTLRRWDSPIRRAGISSFGLGGTNAHAIVEEPPVRERLPAPNGGPFLLPLSAHSVDALADLAGRYVEFLRRSGDSAADICFTAARGRIHREFRLTATGSTKEELSAALEIAAGRSSGRIPRVVFVFPGQGSQCRGMGRELFATDSVFRESIQRTAAAMREWVDWDLSALICEGAEWRLIDVIQPALFAMSVALAERWMAWGIRPEAVVGHSMGEVAAAHISQALSLRDATRIVCTRSRILRLVNGIGAMILVELSEQAALKALAGLESELSIAVCNSAGATVISGATHAVERLESRLASEGVSTFRIKVDVASHSPQMDPLRDELLQALSGIDPQQARIPLLSTVTGEFVSGEDLLPPYWADNLRKTVQFHRAVESLRRQGLDAFIEMSPNPILLPAIDRACTVPSLQRDQPERLTLLSSLGVMYREGAEVNWKAVYPEGQIVDLPAYAWQHERFWIAGSGGSEPPEPMKIAAKAPDKSLSDTERVIAEIWCGVLGISQAGLDDHFFRSGGHSLLAIRLLGQLRQRFSLTIPLSAFLVSPTIRALAEWIGRGSAFLRWSPLVPIQTQGALPPFFCVTPIMGTAFPYYALASLLDRDRPFFALQPPAFDPTRPNITHMEELARFYLEAIRTIQPAGPYYLSGWSFGAHVAYEMARQLEKEGEWAEVCLLFDTLALTPSQKPTPIEVMAFFARRILFSLGPYIRQSSLRDSRGLLRAFWGNLAATENYRPEPSRARVTLLKTAFPMKPGQVDPSWGWGELCRGGVELVDIPGDHMTLLLPPHVQIVAAKVRECLKTGRGLASRC